MKVVGIIGGFGPETTAEFYLEIISRCRQKTKENRPPILIWNVPLEYKIEEELLTKAVGEERYIPYLIDAAKVLERGGAHFLAMPCNTLHVFIDNIRASVKIPVLSIVEETAMFLKQKKIAKVGVLSTTATIRRKLYEGALESRHIRQLVPCVGDQSEIGEIINRIVLGKHESADRKKLLEVVSKFEALGVENVVLACTDLQLLKLDHPGVEIHDTMKILADATVREILTG